MTRPRCIAVTDRHTQCKGLAAAGGEFCGRHAPRAPADTLYFAWHAPILDRAAFHGCLTEDVETGDPLACGECCDGAGP